MYLQKGGPVGRGVALQLDDLVQAALLLALLHADLLLLHQFLGDLKIMETFRNSIRLDFLRSGWVRFHQVSEGIKHTEIGKKAWLFAKLQPGRARKRIDTT